MRTVILLFLTCTIATAQTSASLREKYGNPSSETYRVRPDINVTVTYAKTGEVCEMLIKPASETVNGKPSLLKSQSLKDVIDELVPKDERGTFIIGTFVNLVCLPNNDCAGVDESYQRLSIFSNGSTDAHRFATIRWKRDACESPKSGLAKPNSFGRGRRGRGSQEAPRDRD
jgi:hypothetical protein